MADATKQILQEIILAVIASAAGKAKTPTDTATCCFGKDAFVEASWEYCFKFKQTPAVKKAIENDYASKDIHIFNAMKMIRINKTKQIRFYCKADGSGWYIVYFDIKLEQDQRRQISFHVRGKKFKPYAGGEESHWTGKRDSRKQALKLAKAAGLM